MCIARSYIGVFVVVFFLVLFHRSSISLSIERVLRLSGESEDDFGSTLDSLTFFFSSSSSFRILRARAKRGE